MRVVILADNSVASSEAETHLAELLEKVEAGQEITITRDGTPVAYLIPVKKRKSTVEERTAAIARLRELSKGLSLDGLKIRDLITEGRR